MLLTSIQSDLKKAQLAKDELTVSTLRLLLSEVHNGRIAKGEDLSDEEVLTIIRHEVKKRLEAAEGFRSGGREEQAKKEEAEAKVLEGYLPAQIEDSQLTKIIEDCIQELGVASLDNFGTIMKLVMSKVGSQADGSRVSTKVREKLAQNL